MQINNDFEKNTYIIYEYTKIGDENNENLCSYK